ncbi:MAG TPA: hypothetical protein VGQ33_10755 [Vicinamibacteria bacterium]|nr:hypothetical protein [Vicinamibacteria bacterium]
MSERRPGLLIAAGSVAGTALIVALVFSLAGWAYRQRGTSLHDGRLQRAVAQHPTSAQISGALLAETGTRAVPVPASDEDLRRLLARWPEARADDILAKRRRWPVLRIFAVGDLAYFLFFDGDDKLQDYALGR